MNVPASWSLLHAHTVHGFTEAKLANVGLRLFDGCTRTVVRLRRIHRQPGASVYKESLLRSRDGAMTKEDHELWITHDSTRPNCELTASAKARFDSGSVPHLFLENAFAGEYNGLQCGRSARASGSTILRIVSRDSTPAASKQTCDQYGQVRRVVHLIAEAPVMLISNLRTPSGLVNGAMGRLVGVVLHDSAGASALNADTDFPESVSAQSVRYAVVDFPGYTGMPFWQDHPTWVPVPPVPVRHKRFKAMERLQLPIVLAWGVTIHKSQGLTFRQGAVVDFRHSPGYAPLAQPGLAFVGMSRTPGFEDQGFNFMPDFWSFRKVLQHPLFKARSSLEEKLDEAHDSTMCRLLGRELTVEEDIQQHCQWSRQNKGRELTPEEVEDVRGMLSRRGVIPAPEYDDGPQSGPRGLSGGGGRKQTTAMTPATGASGQSKRKRAAASTPEASTTGAAVASATAASAKTSGDASASATAASTTASCSRASLADPSGKTFGASGSSRPPPPPSVVGTWAFPLVANRRIGKALAEKPPWFNDPRTGAVTVRGTQIAATCGLLAINHCLALVPGDHIVTRNELEGAPVPRLHDDAGNYELQVLGHALLLHGAHHHPVTPDDFASFLGWDEARGSMKLFSRAPLGVLFHVPGHWVSIIPIVEAPTRDNAALLCDSLFRTPFAITAVELDDILAATADKQARAILLPFAAGARVAATWSLYRITF